MTESDIHEVAAHLGLAPRTAEDIAESTGLPIETAYQCLVHLYDGGTARIDIDCARQKHAARGWVAA